LVLAERLRPGGEVARPRLRRRAPGRCPRPQPSLQAPCCPYAAWPAKGPRMPLPTGPAPPASYGAVDGLTGCAPGRSGRRAAAQLPAPVRPLAAAGVPGFQPVAIPATAAGALTAPRFQALLICANLGGATARCLSCPSSTPYLETSLERFPDRTRAERLGAGGRFPLFARHPPPWPVG